MDGTRARALLGVPEHASTLELRRAFRQRALQTHPDHGGNADAFAELVRALAVLEPVAPNGATAATVAPPTSTVHRPATRMHVDTYDVDPTPGSVRRMRPTSASEPRFADVLAAALLAQR